MLVEHHGYVHMLMPRGVVYLLGSRRDALAHGLIRL
jgi:hypothetical protein